MTLRYFFLFLGLCQANVFLDLQKFFSGFASLQDLKKIKMVHKNWIDVENFWNLVKFDGFLGLHDSPWTVTLPFDEHRIGSIATFFCQKQIGLTLFAQQFEFNNCRLKKVDDEDFDGAVEFHFYEVESPLKVHVQGLYVEDHKPSISGAAVLNLVKNMVRSWPGSIAYLKDVSSVQRLALLTTGKSYYEYMGFHYVDPRNGERITNHRKNFQDRQIDGKQFTECISHKLAQEVSADRIKFRFNENLRNALTTAVAAQVGKTHRVKEFWKIYRNVVKNVDFHALQKQYEFRLKITRMAKQFYFARYFFECLKEQMPEAAQEFQTVPENMEYP